VARETRVRELEPKAFAGSPKPLDIRPSLTPKKETPVTVQSVQAHAVETFGSSKKAEHWMSRPNPLFMGKRPKEVVRFDPSSVEAELTRIDHGVYI
jgi:uncharacterized protein (DUF2384 family)